MEIKNNSTYVNPSGMQKRCYNFYTYDDVEMKLRLENEWYQRIYWQGVDCFNKGRGSFVIFDTFTYDDEHLPRLKHYFPDQVLTSTKSKPNKPDDNYFGNYGCFNRAHFPKFMKDLRSALEHDGYDVKNNLKYVYTTEYGHEEDYTDDRGFQRRGTMRPHYHLMLFVTDPTLDPATLNGYVTKLWKYGYHDNGKSPAKFRRNTFHSGMNATDTKVRLRGLANYIGKYMHKDADYEKVISSRIEAVAFSEAKPFMHGMTLKMLKKTPYLYHEWRDAYKLARRKASHLIGTFHGQSQHFGEYALVEPNFDINEVAETGKMKMPDAEKVYKFIPIPLYYRRKLFYEQVMKDDGKLMWRLKDDELSKKFYVNKSYRQAAVMADIYLNLYNQLKVSDKIKVDSWMNGRNMNDLATYSVFFKDCWFDCDLEDIGTDEALEIRLMQDFSEDGLNGNFLNLSKIYSFFQMPHYITQDDRTDFEHFDDVLKVFEPYMEKRHNDLEEDYAKKKREREVMKMIGAKPKK